MQEYLIPGPHVRDRSVTVPLHWGAPATGGTLEVTGGLPGLSADGREVYRRTCPRVAAKTRRFHERYGDDRRPLPLTGEMTYPWMFEEIASLRPFGPAAHALAATPELPALHDPVRLAGNDVPVDAAIHVDDMNVDAGLSLETAEAVGNVRTWVTNEHEHDGLRVGDVLDRLLTLRSR